MDLAFDLIRDLGLQEADELEEVFHQAVRVHAARGEDRLLSRTSLFWACLETSSVLRRVLSANGFSREGYDKSFGPQSVEPDVSLLRGFPINEFIAANLRTYAEMWKSRPLDALGLAAVMLMKPSAEFADHLNAAGLSEGRASACALNLFSIIQREQEAVGNRPESWPEESIEPFDSVMTFDLSYSVNALLVEAGESIHKVAASPVVTTSFLLITILTDSHQVGGALSMLQRRARGHVTDEAFKLRVREWLAWYRGDAPPGMRATFVSRPLLAMLQQARELASGTTGEALIHARHLVAALLSLGNDSGVHRFLSFLGTNVRALRFELQRWIETSVAAGLPDDISVWRKFLGGTSAEQDDGAIIGPAAYIDDQRQVEDRLGFRRDANAFGALIAAKHINPPLSVGIFGDWGAGKTFFMDMIYKSVEANAAGARGGMTTSFVPRIAQIRFNAWHYTEANLWASLVDNIFRGIFEYLRPDSAGEEAIRAQRNELMSQIDAATASQLELQSKVEAARIARDLATHNLEAERARSESTAATVRRLVSTSAWENVEIDCDAKNELQSALKRAGVDRAMTTAAEVRDAVNETSRIGSHLRLFFSWLFLGKWAWLRVLLLIACLAAPFILRALRWELLAPIANNVAARWTLIAAWAVPVFARARNVLKKLDGARKTIETAFANAEATRLSQLDKGREAQASAEKALADAASKLVEAETTVHDAQQKLAELGEGRRLARFIEERAASDDYRKLLGVVATVRKDFDALTTRLTAARGDAFHIDRIVLYIDDLDRCPPERVEQVLQAVHLLLAFKLFVVIVGVDARWVSQSLLMRHPALLGAKETGGGLPGFGARPEDYLEKIFQIPFWLRPMTTQTTVDLIGSLLDAQESDGAPPREQSDVMVPIANEEKSPETASLTAPVNSEPSEPFIDPEIPPPAPEPPPIAPHERELMLRVAPLAGRSPRSAKRFVNIYRLIRSALPAGEIDEFIDERSGNYRPVLLLLAIVVGVPNVAVELFAHILTVGGERKVSDIASGITVDNAKDVAAAAEWQKARDFLIDFAATPAQDLSVGDLQAQIRRVGRYSFQLGRF